MISVVCNDELLRLCCCISQDSEEHSSSVENAQFYACSQVCRDLLCSSQKTKVALPLFRACGGVGGYADR